jgi:hypothetical protein
MTAKKPNAKFQASTAPGGTLETTIAQSKQLVIKQNKELAEIIFGIETRNKYLVINESGSICGAIVERGGGFMTVLKRIFLKTHRPFQIDVFDTANRPVLFFSRKFFFFFSDIEVYTPQGGRVGSAHRRFGILHKIYDLRDQTGQTFARTKSPLWRIWTFNIYDHAQQEKARISKKWGGALKELFTEADNFLIEFGDSNMKPAPRAVIFALAISIDFDFFSNTRRR